MSILKFKYCMHFLAILTCTMLINAVKAICFKYVIYFTKIIRERPGLLFVHGILSGYFCTPFVAGGSCFG